MWSILLDVGQQNTETNTAVFIQEVFSNGAGVSKIVAFFTYTFCIFHIFWHNIVFTFFVACIIICFFGGINLYWYGMVLPVFCNLLLELGCSFPGSQVQLLQPFGLAQVLAILLSPSPMSQAPFSSKLNNNQSQWLFIKEIDNHSFKTMKIFILTVMFRRCWVLDHSDGLLPFHRWTNG